MRLTQEYASNEVAMFSDVALVKGENKLESDFIEAVYQSNLKEVKRCITGNVNPNVIDEDGRAALQMAIEQGDVNLLNLLLSTPNIDVNLRDQIGITPLMVASYSSQRPALQNLLQAGADPNLVDDHANTALHYAVLHGNTGIVWDLVRAKASVSPLNIFDETPLSIAIIDRPSMPIARYLLDNGARLPTPKNMPILLEATLNCNSQSRLELVKLLASKMDLKRTHPMTKVNCLHIVGMTGYFPLAKFLIEHGADWRAVDSSGRTPYDVALQHDFPEIAQLFKEGPQKKTVGFADNVTIA